MHYSQAMVHSIINNQLVRFLGKNQFGITIWKTFCICYVFRILSQYPTTNKSCMYLLQGISNYTDTQ